MRCHAHDHLKWELCQGTQQPTVEAICDETCFFFLFTCLNDVWVCSGAFEGFVGPPQATLRAFVSVVGMMVVLSSCWRQASEGLLGGRDDDSTSNCMPRLPLSMIVDVCTSLGSITAAFLVVLPLRSIFCYFRKTCIAGYAHKSANISTAVPISGFYGFDIDLSTSIRPGVALMDSWGLA